MLKRFFNNTRKPEGVLGKFMVAAMNSGHAALARWGLSHLALEREDEILDVGCGGGANISVLLRLCPEGKVSGLDHSEVSVEAARKKNAFAITSGRCDVMQGDVSSLSFAADSFDVVTAFETVYFWPEIENAFREVQRVLRPGGTFFICNESDGEKPSEEKWTEIIDGMTIYTAEQLTTFLNMAGFSAIQVYRGKKKGWLCITAIKP